MYDIQQIKSRITCVEYAQRMGLPIRRSGDRCKSPLRAESKNKSSFSVSNECWYDFADCKGGDVIDFSALLNHKGDRGLAIQELAQLTGVISDRDIPDWQQITQRRCNDIATWHSALRKQDRDYLHERRISDETIEQLRIGYTGLGLEVRIKGEKVYGFAANRIVVPVYKNGYVISWVARATTDSQTPKYLKQPVDDMTEYEPWGLHTLDRENDTLYIAEGTFDALALDQSGCSVLASMGGDFSRETLKAALSIAENFKNIILTFDNDKAGRKFTQRLGEILFSHRINFSVAGIPPQYKDISDYYAAGNEIEDLQIADGLTFIATKIKNKEDFKTFAFKAARILDRAELAELFSSIEKEEEFSGIWLKEIRSACYKAPPETVIVDEILKKHKLLYITAVGFYEYGAQGYWRLLKDEVIHGYIADELGAFASGNKLEPIKKLLRSEVFSEKEFNKKELVNFINGTLELKTGTFRGHSEDDYCSLQLPYPYIPEAKCPRWRQFIREVTDNDAKREENLQYIIGYTLFADCRLHKVFVLTGDGGNGKSVFTDILDRLFGEENVTHITPQGMVDAFERIHLRHSILNVASEIKTDISLAEEYLKQVSAGDKIQACFKGKDHVNFISRAKLVFACNGQLKSSDTSDALTRRLIIIDFPCKFVDYPDKNNLREFQKDIDLPKKLLKELPGIFNWGYQGYKELLHYKNITETNEHEEHMENFRRASNPVLCFVEDYMDNKPARRILRSEMYDQYAAWCEHNGHKKLASNKFHPVFRKCTEKFYDVFEESKRIEGLPRRIKGYVLKKNY